MHIVIFGHEVVPEEELNQLKAAAAAAGHTVITAAGSETDKLVVAAKTAFPQLVTDAKSIIETLKTKTNADGTSMSGGDKAIALAVELAKTAPDVLTALPNAKDFLVKLGTSIYTDGLDELKTAATAALTEVEKLL